MSSPGFFSSLSFKAGLPSDSGVMEDRDWMSPKDELTHFSSHTNKTSQFFSLDVSIGVSLPVKSYFYIKPFVTGSWMRFAFSGRDGYGKYPNGEFQFMGDVIGYMQEWLLFSPGVSVGSKILSPFSIDFSFKMSVFTYCADIDEHYTRKITFLDYTSYGLFLESAVCLSYSFKRIEHSLEFSRKFIDKTRGVTYGNANNTGYYLLPNNSGAGLSFLDMRYLLKIRF
jgi:outer membrane protease